MFTQTQSSLPAHGTISVDRTGVTCGGSYIAFRHLPASEPDRGAPASLMQVARGRTKRSEQRSPALACGGETTSTRVRHCHVDTTLPVRTARARRVDLRTAIPRGLPVGALPPDLYGCRACGHEVIRGAKASLVPAPANIVEQVMAAWAIWLSVNSPAVMPVSRSPLAGNLSVDRLAVGALAALTEAAPPRPNLARWASVAGRAPNQRPCSAADVARRLRLRRQTAEGQALFALLLHHAAN